jgi:hypothetical protein
MNKKTLIVLFIIIIALIVGLYFINTPRKNKEEVVVNNPSTNKTSIIYKNTDYGFNFSLPASWQGYSIIKEEWQGNMLTDKAKQSGPKLIIRNPKWTESVHYEDLPILVFTITQWNSYLKEDFAVSAAPILASELARNNVYVFALPPRWDFDYSLGYEEAQNIFASNSLKPFNIELSQK